MGAMQPANGCVHEWNGRAFKNKIVLRSSFIWSHNYVHFPTDFKPTAAQSMHIRFIHSIECGHFSTYFVGPTKCLFYL